jgi:cobalt-zinc-cadmium efflux system protein
MKHKHKQRYSRLFWTIILNIIITITEYIGGLFTGSLALISDAGHNLSDVLSLLLTYIGEKLSKSGINHKFSFGLKRVEVLTAFINAIALWAIALYILYEAYKRYLNPVEIIPLPMLGIAVIGLGGNVFSILILNKEKNLNLNRKAAYLHLFYDAVSSVGVIIGGTVILLSNFFVIDLIISTLIALMIFWSGLDVIKESIGIFMQAVPRDINFNKVKNALLQFPEIASVHDLHIWAISSKEPVLSCHICLCNPKKTKTDKLIKRIEKKLEKDFNIRHSTIQIENEKICKKENGEYCCR